MAQFMAVGSKVEVNGETVLSVVNGLGVFKKKGLEILSANGIEDPQPGVWYSQQAWLNGFREIYEKIGSKSLLAIGKAIPSNAKFPPEIDSIEKALSAIDVAYHMNHRGGDIGFYKFEKMSDNKGRVICENPYPCDFDLGIVESMAKRFKPTNVLLVLVEHDKTCGCRKDGAKSCIYNVSW